ncbi:hypothetical protein F511_01940 [Dorcoceras hygrometricum]|uniref:Uncharacterized protein n=1 Tax=Dorcoceras hygrometricum TaxID=472368 RepID=A0A2Z7AVQ7_9LAMI|nr:hypothetical protein F511_01940 [Dorcoceras hygrometricum]
MEKLLNPHDKEYMRKAMLRHEETFRDQVIELHRLYRTQKMLMKDLATLDRNGTSHSSCNNNSRARKYVDPGQNSRALGDHDQSTDLELTLGPRRYHQRKIKAAEPGTDVTGFGQGFSSSSCMKRTREGFLNKQNQETLDNSHWTLQVSSFKMT